MVYESINLLLFKKTFYIYYKWLQPLYSVAFSVLQNLLQTYYSGKKPTTNP